MLAFESCNFSLCLLQMSITVDGFDDAKIGVMSRAGQDDIVVYNYGKCVDILMKREGWSDEEAEQWIEYNEIGVFVGDDGTVLVCNE